MKKCAVYLFLLWPLFGLSQTDFPSEFSVIPEGRSYSLNAQVTSIEAAKNLLKEQHRYLSYPEYQVYDAIAKQSLTGNHYTFKITKDDIPIFGAEIRIHTDLDGKITWIQDNIPFVENSANSVLFTESGKKYWVKTLEGYQIGYLGHANEFGQASLTVNGNDLHTVQTKLFNHTPDTMVKGQVFLINPLNTAMRDYGSPYIDSTDLDVPQINAERKWVNFKAHFANDTFWLKNDRYYFAQISDPVTPQTFSLTDTFSFLRSAYQFEDVNAYFHVSNFSNYVEALGFETALPDTLVIDAHGYSGGDFSTFNYGIFPVELEFGEGGVDDAEDGETIVHEFSHSLSYFAGGDSYANTRDRSAMEEGACDYFCTAYGDQYSTYARTKVFNWDGHNPFFEGVYIGTSLQYPGDLTGNTNVDREVWSTPLLCLHDKIGRGPTDSLVLEQLYYQFKSATIPDMANIILKLDSSMFQGKYEKDIRDCFSQHSILLSNRTSVSFETQFKAYNTIGFANGTDYAVITSLNSIPFDCKVYDLNGKLISEMNSVSKAEIDPYNFVSGVYFVELIKENQSSFLKLMRQ